MMGELNPHENPTHIIQIPKHNNGHDNKFDNVEIIDKKLRAPRGMEKI